MRIHKIATAFIALAILLSCFVNSNAEDKEKPKQKLREEKIRDITLKVPESWKRVEVPNRLKNLRAAQFEVPKAEGDKETVHLIISNFRGGGGGVDPNIKRWRGEFQDLKIKLTRGKSKQGEYVFADLSGTHVGSSFRRRPKPLEDARMLGVVLAVEKKGIYFLKMTGPKKTIKQAEKAFRASFGANAKKEKEYKPEN